MPARIGRLSAGEGSRHPVTIRKASLMAGSMRWVWALRLQSGAQCSALEWMADKVAIRNVLAPAHQPNPASGLKSATLDVNFCEMTRGVSDTWAIFPMLLRGIWARRAGFRYCSRLSAHVASSWKPISMHVENPIQKMQQYRIVRKKQTVDPSLHLPTVTRLGCHCPSNSYML